MKPDPKKTLADLVVGDRVICGPRSLRRVQTVVRRTKTKFVTDDGAEWSIRTGHRWGDSCGGWTRDLVVPATDEDVQEIRRRAIRQRVRAKALKLEELTRGLPEDPTWGQAGALSRVGAILKRAIQEVGTLVGESR